MIQKFRYTTIYDTMYKKDKEQIMKKNNHILIYTLIWGFAIIFLIIMLYQNNGNARVINYTGIVRGGTQQLVKQELFGYHNEKFMENLDEILYELQTGKGSHNITPCKSSDYQEQLAKMQTIWQQIKEEIKQTEHGADPQHLYDLSEAYFKAADVAVSKAEVYTESLIHLSITALVIYLLLSIFCLVLWNIHKERQIKKIYYTDPLTNAYNKSAFEMKIKHILSVYKYPYSILYFDIDGFKRINDEYGYEAGDQLLKEIAEFLKYQMDENSECFARPSADYYMVLMRRDIHEIHDFSMNLTQYLYDHLEYIGAIDITYGIYDLPEHAREEIPNMIDKAMIAHKLCKSRHGINILSYHDDLMKVLEYENKLTSNMQKALSQKEFKMYLQPKIDLKNNALIGAEALVRWISPELGFIPPDNFIPLFEKNEFISELDFYMLEQVCKYLKESLQKDAKHTIAISVNVSRITLLQRDFLKRFDDMINSYQIPPHYIEVELTENAFDRLDQSAIHILKQLQQNGHAISMDDFGSGYSSLNLLRTIPLNVLKLDREFINEQETSKETIGIISCVIDIAHVMNLKVICEGVETQAQQVMLKEIGCDYAQGFLYSKPIPVEEFQQKYFHS